MTGEIEGMSEYQLLKAVRRSMILASTAIPNKALVVTVICAPRR